jgi:hypothetical protein
MIRYDPNFQDKKWSGNQDRFAGPGIHFDLHKGERK